MAGSNVSLKLLIDSKEQRVLFGEADKTVIDFLFNLLSLPLGTVIKLLKNQGMVGCLPNLYKSVEALNHTYLQPNQSKDILLNPKVSFSCGSNLLFPNVESSSATKIYLCPSRCGYNVANDLKAICPTPNCRRQMNYVGKSVNPPNAESTQKATNVEGGGFVKGVVTYMVMDDLTVKPMSTISSITLLNKFNVKEVNALEEKVVTLDINQGVKLLKASLQSKTVLTDVFLGSISLNFEDCSTILEEQKDEEDNEEEEEDDEEEDNEEEEEDDVEEDNEEEEEDDDDEDDDEEEYRSFTVLY